MLYILAGLTGTCALIGAAEMVVRIWDRIVPPEKESAPTVGAAEGTKRNNTTIIYDRNGGMSSV